MRTTLVVYVDLGSNEVYVMNKSYEEIFFENLKKEGANVESDFDRWEINDDYARISLRTNFSIN